MHSSKKTKKYYHKNYCQFFHFCFAFFGTFFHAFGSIFDTHIKALKINSDRKKKRLKRCYSRNQFSFFYNFHCSSMYSLIDSEAHQFLPETFGFLFHKCFSSKEWSICLELTSEPQSCLKRGVIMPQVLMPVFITFLGT